jgi:hypothetical protein
MKRTAADGSAIESCRLTKKRRRAAKGSEPFATRQRLLQRGG